MYRDDTDPIACQGVLALTCERYHFVVHSFCQMSNHYHLLVETVEANLSQGMRQLNDVYTQHFNRRHKLVARYTNSSDTIWGAIKRTCPALPGLA
ncbi:transposase [Janthinobacterium sp. PSPC1-1]|uniref:transposase n=1 Tax=Janthinobacterium sp. PSPC1-1 TaxID=2804581 RepID=UPI003CEEF152